MVYQGKIVKVWKVSFHIVQNLAGNIFLIYIAAQRPHCHTFPNPLCGDIISILPRVNMSGYIRDTSGSEKIGVIVAESKARIKWKFL